MLQLYISGRMNYIGCFAKNQSNLTPLIHDPIDSKSIESDPIDFPVAAIKPSCFFAS
jgi:hypothetical protein